MALTPRPLEEFDIVFKGEVVGAQTAAHRFEERGRHDGEVGNAHGEKQHDDDVRNGKDAPPERHLLVGDAHALAAHHLIRLLLGEVVLNEPQREAEDGEDDGEHRRHAEVDGRDRRVLLDARRKDVERGRHLKADDGGGAVFADGADKHEDGGDGVVAQHHGCEDLSEAIEEPAAAHRARLVERGGNVEHGVLHEREHEGEGVEGHDERQSPEGVEEVLRVGDEGQKLLQKAVAPQKARPAHRRDVGRGHEGDHEHDVHPLGLGKARPREDVRERKGDDGRHRRDAEA